MAPDFEALTTTGKRRPGDKLIVPPQKTLEEMLEREACDYEMVDFYLAKKSL